MERAAAEITAQQRVILELLAQGQTVNRIATIVGLPARGVTRQIEACRGKLHARNNSMLVAKAASMGLLQP